MNFEDIIKNEYNNLTKSLENIIKDHPKYTINIVDDLNDNIMDIFGNSKKKVLTVKYEVLGTYNITLGIFIWACDNVIGDKEISELSKTTKKYSKNLKKLIIDKKFKDISYIERLYYYLSNSMFFVDPINLNDITKLSTFVTNTNGIIKQNSSNALNHEIITMYYVTDIISY